MSFRENYERGYLVVPVPTQAFDLALIDFARPSEIGMAIGNHLHVRTHLDRGYLVVKRPWKVIYQPVPHTRL